MLIHFLEREFDYNGLNTEQGAFEYTRECSGCAATLLIRVYDDAYITASRVYINNKVTDEYLISSVSHLISAITDDTKWEEYVVETTHESLSLSLLRRLYLNAPLSVKKQLRRHPQYQVVVEQVSKQIQSDNKLTHLIEGIQRVMGDDPYRAYGEAVALYNKYENNQDVEKLLDETERRRREWDKLLRHATALGQVEAQKQFDAATYTRIAKALRWTETKSNGTHRPVAMSHNLSCEGAKLLPKLKQQRVTFLSRHYGETYDNELLEAIVVLCDDNNIVIDLTKKLEDQFEF